MKCKACGFENANETGYCINCGAKLEPERVADEPVQNPVQNPAHVYTQPVYAVQEKVPEAYKPISAWAYFGYRLLFCIPVIGFILLIVFSLSDENINRRNFARSYWCDLVLGTILGIITLVIVLILASAGVAVGNYYYY